MKCFCETQKFTFLPNTFKNRAPYNEIFFIYSTRYYLLRNLVKKIFLLLSWLTFVGKHSRFYREIFALLLCIYYLACSALCTTIPHYSKKGKNYTTIEFKWVLHIAAEAKINMYPKIALYWGGFLSLLDNAPKTIPTWVCYPKVILEHCAYLLWRAEFE